MQNPACEREFYVLEVNWQLLDVLTVAVMSVFIMILSKSGIFCC